MTVRAYRLVAKIKNNRLWTAIQVRWPMVVTQSEAARRLRVEPTTLGSLLNMTRWPYSRRKADWTPMAYRVAFALKQSPEYLFAGALYGERPAPVSLALDAPMVRRLEALSPAPDELAAQAELRDVLRDAMARLTDRERFVLNQRYEANATFEEIGAALTPLPVTVERARQIASTALRKLRHRSRHTRRLHQFAQEDYRP